MAAVKSLNPKAEVARAAQALQVNISAARGLQDVLRTNLGPKGTMKMYERLHVILNMLLSWFRRFPQVGVWCWGHQTDKGWQCTSP